MLMLMMMVTVRFHVEEEGKGVDAAGGEVKADKEAVTKFRQSLRFDKIVIIMVTMKIAFRAKAKKEGPFPSSAGHYFLKDHLSATPSPPLLELFLGRWHMSSMKHIEAIVVNIIDHEKSTNKFNI